MSCDLEAAIHTAIGVVLPDAQVTVLIWVVLELSFGYVDSLFQLNLLV